MFTDIIIREYTGTSCISTEYFNSVYNGSGIFHVNPPAVTQYPIALMY